MVCWRIAPAPKSVYPDTLLFTAFASSLTNICINTNRLHWLCHFHLQLDAKNILFYLEGLVGRTDEQELVELRNQIKVKQKQYLNDAKQDLSSLYRKPRIVEDEKEFWKYLMKNGVIQFLSDTYDERIKEIEQEQHQVQENKESSLGDEYSIVKTNLRNLKTLFLTMKKDFRLKKEDLNLDQQIQLIELIENIIPVVCISRAARLPSLAPPAHALSPCVLPLSAPGEEGARCCLARWGSETPCECARAAQQRKITKFGKNFRIEKTKSKKITIETYDTLAEDQSAEGLKDEKGMAESKDSKFKKALQIFFLRNRIPIPQLEDFLNSQSVQLLYADTAYAPPTATSGNQMLGGKPPRLLIPCQGHAIALAHTSSRPHTVAHGHTHTHKHAAPPAYN